MASSANSTMNGAAVGSTSKHQKVQNKDNSSSNRISNLPEPLLSRILSLLPTKEAVATSILSTRWRFLWTSITNLNFPDEGIYDPNFIKYVNRILLLLDPPSIHKFSFSFYEFSDLFHINTWISAALVRNVRDMELPRSVFYCKALEVLKLAEGIVFNIPKVGSVCFTNLKVLHLDPVDCGEIPAEGMMCFPVLKILHLDRVDYVENDDSVSKLMRNCPVLEDLLIRTTFRDNSSNIDMFAPALRIAEIDFRYKCIGCKVQIDAPVLQCLKIVDWNPSHEFLIKEPDSLIEAKLINSYKCGD